MPNQNENYSERIKDGANAAEQQLAQLQKRFEAIAEGERKVATAASDMGRVLLDVLSKIDTRSKSVDSVIANLSEIIRSFSTLNAQSQNNAPSNTPLINRNSLGTNNAPARNFTNPAPIQINLNSPDVEGIRRSEAQLTTMIARATNRGNRQI